MIKWIECNLPWEYSEHEKASEMFSKLSNNGLGTDGNKEDDFFYEEVGKLYEEWDKKSFHGLRLDKPGTLVELSTGEMLFIGSRNPIYDLEGGNFLIVKRYAIIFDYYKFICDELAKEGERLNCIKMEMWQSGR